MGKLGLKANAFAFFGFSFCLLISNAYAGVFNIPHFIAPGEWGVGIEPELTFSGGLNLAVQGRYVHGISDLSNAHAILGTGGGARQFRVGGAVTFDFFPDIGNQPGIGLAIQGLFVNLPTAGSVELTAIPYIRKSFIVMEKQVVEPFFAVPVGLSLSQGLYSTLSSLVFGSLFEHNEHLRSVLELGIGLSTTSTYISGGLVYYH